MIKSIIQKIFRYKFSIQIHANSSIQFISTHSSIFLEITLILFNFSGFFPVSCDNIAILFSKTRVGLDFEEVLRRSECKVRGEIRCEIAISLIETQRLRS